ncbi:hypothetical protein BDV93DRAFT_522978 [Ceratobasidium sp. AG-I]|nr:hypothetical protein BDV93DRAFT_522978 [Ceratobasidium sp. AG-I]
MVAECNGAARFELLSHLIDGSPHNYLLPTPLSIFYSVALFSVFTSATNVRPLCYASPNFFSSPFVLFLSTISFPAPFPS